MSSDSLLRQLPYFDDGLIANLKEQGVEDIADLMNMDDAKRDSALAHLDKEQVELVAKACNRYLKSYNK